MNPQVANSGQTCGRTALINYQEILVDLSSKNRGEGLRYYLEKDPISEHLLNEYQKNNRPTWRNAALSTLGSAMILSGVLTNQENGGGQFTNKNFLIFGGMTMIAVSYLTLKTNQYKNEYLFLKSIEEYNKRNTPKIYFSPTGFGQNMGGGLGVRQNF